MTNTPSSEIRILRIRAEVDGALAGFSHHPQADRFAFPEWRERLVEYVIQHLSRVNHLDIDTPDPQLQILITEGIHHLTLEHTQVASHHPYGQPPGESESAPPSCWFG